MTWSSPAGTSSALLYEAARTAQVLDRDQLDQIRPFLESIEPLPAVFDQHYGEAPDGEEGEDRHKCDLANQIV